MCIRDSHYSGYRIPDLSRLLEGLMPHVWQTRGDPCRQRDGSSPNRGEEAFSGATRGCIPIKDGGVLAWCRSHLRGGNSRYDLEISWPWPSPASGEPRGHEDVSGVHPDGRVCRGHEGRSPRPNERTLQG